MGTTLIWKSALLLLMAVQVFHAQDLAPSNNVSLCKLYEHPEDYTGKMIKVRAGSIGSLSLEDLLHDTRPRPCSAYIRIIVVFPDHVKPVPDFDLLQDAAFKRLEVALHSTGPIHIDATYEGRFDALFVWRDHQRLRIGQGSDLGFGKKHEYDARIVLREVSDVWWEQLPRR